MYDIGKGRLKYLSPLYSIGKKETNAANRVLAVRHELHELNEYQRNKKISPVMLNRKAGGFQTGLVKTLRVPVSFAERHLKEGSHSHKAVKEFRIILDDVINKRIGSPVGQHYSLAVLGKESNDQNLLGGLYGAKNSMSPLRIKKTKESSILNRIIGKEYGQHFNNKDIKKLRSAPPDFNIADHKGFVTE